MNYCFPFRFALKNNLPVLQHVSLPRVGALHAIVDTVGPEKNPGGNSSGDPTVNCDGMNFVWNVNISNIEYVFLLGLSSHCVTYKIQEQRAINMTISSVVFIFAIHFNHKVSSSSIFKNT
jgi:hypothetical protein